MKKTFVTISRKWNNPQITTVIDREGISVIIPLMDFAEALAREIGPVTWIFMDATFRAKFDAAVEAVLEGMKAETVKVV